MKLSTVKTQLVACGYRPDWLRHDYRFRDDQTVKPLVGFAQLPFDARSSCIAVLESEGEIRDAKSTNAVRPGLHWFLSVRTIRCSGGLRESAKRNSKNP